MVCFERPSLRAACDHVNESAKPCIGPTSIATLNYADAVYEEITTLGEICTREEVTERVLQRLKDGQVWVLSS